MSPSFGNNKLNINNINRYLNDNGKGHLRYMEGCLFWIIYWLNCYWCINVIIIRFFTIYVNYNKNLC